MKSLISLLAIVFLGSTAFAEVHKSLQCETGNYKLTTYQSPTAPDEVLVLVQENEEGIYQNVFSELHEKAPVAAWHLRELQNTENIFNIVATGDNGSAVADVNIDMGKYGVIRAFGISCQLNIFNVQ